MGTIAKRIRLLRESKGLTGDAVAERAGIRPSTISLLENEERTNPHAHTLSAIAMALETTTDYLVGLSDNPTRRNCDELTKRNGDLDLQAILASWPFLADESRRVLAEMSQLLAKRQRQLMDTLTDS
jgi:transcriptional regulator with XRE-family HTH domain